MEKISGAEKVIYENMRTLSPFLDLGNCGLTDSSPELRVLKDCNHLDGISLGTYYYSSGKEQRSVNKGAANEFSAIPSTLPLNIRELYIAEAKLKTIDALNLYQQLAFFDGFGNAISSLSGLDGNDHMISFGVSRNEITQLDGVTNFHHLKYLYVGDNKISVIRKSVISTLSELVELYIYANELTSIEFLEEKVSLNLKKIDAHNNKLVSINTLSNLTHLEEIDLSGNRLETKFTNEIIQSKSAIRIRSILLNISVPALIIKDNISKKDPVLDLGNCGLTNGSPELDQLKDCDHVERLNLGTDYFDKSGQNVLSKNKGNANNFVLVPSKLPTGLKQLQVRHSQIKFMSNLDGLLRLRLLDLSFNNIDEIANIAHLEGLRELALHGNYIQQFHKVTFPPQLKILHLSNNKINSLTGIEQCEKLTDLILYDNNIVNIFPITGLANLKRISLQNNPIMDCPSEIWTNNNVLQIKDYFKEINKSLKQQPIQGDPIRPFNSPGSPEVSNDVKLIILGNSNTGKTHLVHYLETGNCLNQRNSTHGLDVKRWHPDIKRFPQLENVEVSIWDFGGQEYYHDSFRLFLGSNAVYVVMWSSDSDHNDKSEETLVDNEPKVPLNHYEKQYWLDTVKFFRDENANTPLLLVQNKVDDPPSQKKRISQELHETYQINESFHISIINGCDSTQPVQVKNLENFSAYLADCLAKLAHQNAQFSDDFKYIRNEVLKLSEPGKESIFGDENDLYIERDKFNEICKSHKPDINPEHYPNWLHNGGVLVFFENNALLNDRVFINPRKLSEKIYAILNKEVHKVYGEILIDDTLKKNQLIIDVMINLNIIYPHPQKSTHYLAPQYLPEDHPVEDLFKIASGNAWQDSYWIKVPLFYYKRLMNHLLLSNISTDTNDARYFWKNGIMLLKKTDKRVLIKGLFPNEKDGIIQVSVEDNDAELQKEIFGKILAFKVNNSDQKLIDNNDLKNTGNIFSVKEKLYLEKLQLSVDKIEYIPYEKLRTLNQQSPENSNNLLIKFKHIVPFEIKGTEPKIVFVSYSHSNTLWLSKIRNHLSGLRRSNYIKEWTDQEILVGEKWDNKIKEQIKKADIFILLLSAEFIASEYIWKIELQEAFNSRKTIIPVYIESCDLVAMPNINDDKINDFEIIPKFENKLKPVNLWDNEAQALTVVASRIREVVMLPKT